MRKLIRARLNHRVMFVIVLSVIFGWSNVLAAHVVESTFWEKRRVNAGRMKGEAFPSTDKSDSSIGQLSEKAAILAQLPQLGQFNFGVGVRSRTSMSTPDGFSSAVGPLDISPSSDSTPSWISSLILPFGSIREIHLSKKPGAPLFIHIQDAHGIEEAQKNMASMIRGLSEERGVNLVGLESASGAFNLSPYRDWPDVSVARDVAECFLKEGKIGGAEFVGITAPQPPILWGIENPDLYLENVQALLDSNKLKPKMVKVLSGITNSVSALKDTFYSKELKDFDRHYLDYQAQKEALGPYVRYLTGVSQVGSRLPNLHFLVNAFDAENSLDFKRVEKERLQLVERLIQRLSKARLDLLVQRSFQYRAGQIGYGDYHRFLQALCRDNSVPLAEFPQLNAYIEYILLAEKIDRNTLLDELSQAEREAQERLAITPEQKRLVAVTRRLSLIRKMSIQAMTPEDWAAYEKERDPVLNIASDLAALSPSGHTPDPGEMAALLKPFEDFCRKAVGRNAAFVENVSAQMGIQHATSAVLVAGGFHTDGLTQLFRERDLSYVVVTPKITEVPKDNHYLDVFARDPLPLEKLFAGQEIFLNSVRLTVWKPLFGSEAQTVAFVREWVATAAAVMASWLDKSAFPALERKAELASRAGGAPMAISLTKIGEKEVDAVVATTKGGPPSIDITVCPSGRVSLSTSRAPILRKRALSERVLTYRRARSSAFDSTIRRGRMIVPTLLGGIGLALGGVVALTISALSPLFFSASMVVMGSVLHVGLARKWGWAESVTDFLTSVFLAGAMERRLLMNSQDRKAMVALHSNANRARVPLLKALRRSMAIERLANRLASRLAIRVESLTVPALFNPLTRMTAQLIRQLGARLGIVGHHLWHDYSNMVYEGYQKRLLSYAFAKALTGYSPVRATTDIDPKNKSHDDALQRGGMGQYQERVRDILWNNLESKLGEPLIVDLWTAFEIARKRGEVLCYFDPKELLKIPPQERVISEDDVAVIKGIVHTIERSYFFSKRGTKLDPSLQSKNLIKFDVPSLTEVELAIVKNLADSEMRKNPSCADQILGRYKYFYVKVLKEMESYVVPNPLKVWSVMGIAIRDPSVDLLGDLDYWGHDRRFKEKFSIDPAPQGTFSEGLSDISYDEYLEDYIESGIRSFTEITSRAPTELEITNFRRFAEQFFNGNSDGDGFTLKQSILFHAQEIKNVGGNSAAHAETLGKGLSRSPLLVVVIGLALSWWLGVWVAAFSLMVGALLYVGALLKWGWSIAIVDFITRTLLAGFMEYRELQTEKTFLVWVGKHATQFQSEIAKSGRSFLKWQHVGEGRSVAGLAAGMVGFLAAVKFLQCFFTGIPIEALMGIGALSGAISQTFLWNVFSKPTGYVFHVLAHSWHNVGSYVSKIPRLTVQRAVATTSSIPFEGKTKSTDLNALLLRWERTGDLAVLNELVAGSQKVDWNGLIPRVSGSMEPIFAQLNPQGQAALSVLLGQLGHVGIRDNDIEASFFRGLLVAGWRGILTSSPGGFLYLDAGPLADPKDSETRMLVETFLDALSANVQANPDQHQVQRYFIGYDRAETHAHIVLKYPNLMNARFLKNKWHGRDLAVGPVATIAKNLKAAFLPVYTRREINTQGTPRGIHVQRRAYRLLDAMKNVLDILAKVLSYA